MNNRFLPQGKDALLFDNVDYNIPGLFIFSELIYKYVETVKNKFNLDLPIRTVYGAPSIKWNGGRLLFNHPISKKEIEEELIKPIDYKIVPLLSFSNLYISKEDLNDEIGNYILGILNEIKGEVIVSSPILEMYIRELYPNMPVHVSVICTAFEENRSAAYYNSLSCKYSTYVVNPDDNFNIELLKALPKSNAEILINERCKLNCDMRKHHYESISREQNALSQNKYKDEHFLNTCSMIPENKQLNCNKNNISCSMSEIKKILSLGFKNIKIQGRLDNLYSVFFDIMRYTLENDVAFPNLYPIFNYEIEKYIRRDD